MAGEVPAGIGGLVRYNEEYKSKINLSPAYVVGFVMVLIFFVLLLRIFFPVG